jgi:hypothetical protein
VPKIQIFVSFDLEHDADLCAQLLAQSAIPSFGFEVTGQSRARSANEPPGDAVRRQIREADEVIVICGEHTEESIRVSAELRMAQEEQKPYFLLWGRRERMCTKPVSAKRNEGMYRWTSDVLQLQISSTLRTSRWEPQPRGGQASRTA